MTNEDRQRLRADVAGFAGRFFYDAERSDLAFVAARCEARECDCPPSYNSDGEIDCSRCIGFLEDGEAVGEPMARMLNAVGPLLDEVDTWHRIAERDHGAPIETVEALRKENDRLRRDRDSYANSDFERQLDEVRQQLVAAQQECERLREEMGHATAHDGDWLSKTSRAMCETVFSERDALREKVKALAFASDANVSAWRHSQEALSAMTMARDTLADIASSLTAPEHLDIHARIAELRKVGGQ